MPSGPGQSPRIEDDERFGRLNFQPLDRLAQLVEFLRTPLPSRVAVLSGPDRIGRGYLLEAALYRLREAGQSWDSIDLDLEGYEPDAVTAESFLEHALLRRSATADQRIELVRILKPTLEILDKAGPGTAWIGTVLGLARPASELLSLLRVVTAHPLPPLPPRERIDRLFDLLLDQLADNVAVLVRASHRLPITFKRMLYQLCARRPSAAVIFTALPEDETESIAPAVAQPALRIELEALRAAELKAAMARNFTPNRLPSELSDVLWQASRGMPPDIAARLGELIAIGILAPDAQGTWRLAGEGLEATPLVRLFSYPFYDPLDRLLRALNSQARRQSVERFLAAAVVCGDNVPANAVCEALGFDEQARDQVLDFVDEHLVAGEETALPELSDEEEGIDDVRLPMFLDLQYKHPGLPRTAVYAFTHPIYRHAIHDRLGIGGWQTLANQLLSAFNRTLPPFTRAAAEIHLSAVTFLNDEAARANHLNDLSWLVDVQECEALAEALTEQLARHDLDPEKLWAAIERSKWWRPQRRHALLAAYGSQSEGPPLHRAGEYHLAFGDVLRDLGQYRSALFHLLRSVRIFRGQYVPQRACIALTRCSECLRELAKTRSALSFATSALSLAETCLEAKHPNLGLVTNNYGMALSARGDHAGARAALERALRILEHAYGPEDPSVAAAKQDLGTELWQLGDYLGAKAVHERALDIMEKFFAPEHPKVGFAAISLAADLSSLGEHDDAKATSKRALDILEKVLGPEHPIVAIASLTRGAVLRDAGDLAGAKTAGVRALRTMEAAFSPRHPNVVSAAISLGKTLHALGDRAGAKAAFARACDILTLALGANHAETLEARRRLESLD